MANRRHAVITLGRLHSALGTVQNELDRHGLWNDRLYDVDVYLTGCGFAYGWQMHRSTGHIKIPAISINRISEFVFGGPRRTLRDLLRHEYAHAIADTHRGLIRSRQFSDAFGSSHDSCIEAKYCETEHVTHYAATDSSEDFAEVFMYFLKHRGRLPHRFQTPSIRSKWRFVRQLSAVIGNHQRRW
ncbi:MAG: hypothetical protein HKN47_05660 [Pirellulaceae bacterium]|nr:hypothetical protein [Pirellulaceae bacterium]